MATRFAKPVTDAEEVRTAVPGNTKQTTEWGIRVWNDWAPNRVISVADHDGVVPVTTPLLKMPPRDLLDGVSLFWRFARKTVRNTQNTWYCLVCFYESNGIHDVNPLNDTSLEILEQRLMLK